MMASLSRGCAVLARAGSACMCCLRSPATNMTRPCVTFAAVCRHRHLASLVSMRACHHSSTRRVPGGKWKSQVFASVDGDDEATIVGADADREFDSVDGLEDSMFDMFSEDGNHLQIGRFLTALHETGVRSSDRRVAELYSNLEQVFVANQHTAHAHSATNQLVDRASFRSIIRDNIHLVSRAIKRRFIVPDFASVCRDIDTIYQQCASLNHGQVASYISQLARYDPNYWAVSLCSVDGQRYCLGDVHVPYTVQSVSKPLTYGLALDELGARVVHQYVGQEPSGRMFNELVLDHNRQPHNPMINAGAIVVCSLLASLVHAQRDGAARFDHIRDYFARLSGGEYVGFNNAVFLSEREAADRNYALGFYMRENKCFPSNTVLSDVMDFYFQTCALETTCDAMAVMAATLANGGVCPTTAEKVLQTHSVRDVLSLMHSCGMYDYSGQFAFTVGLPGKSGVSGCMMLVVPGVMGVCLWSPPLDAYGNSVRGIRFCQEFVKMFNFHRYDNLRSGTDKKDPRRHMYEMKGVKIVNLLFAASCGDVSALRRHKLSGMDMSECDYDGRTALHVAACENQLTAAEFLVRQCGVSTHIADRWQCTALDNARQFGHESMVRLLSQYTTPNDVETTPTNAETTPTNAETTPTNAETTPICAETTPTNAETTPTNAETTPISAEGTPICVETTPTNAETTPICVETTPTNAETTPISAEATCTAKILKLPANTNNMPELKK